MTRTISKLFFLSAIFATLWLTSLIFTSISIETVPPFHFIALKLLTGALFIILVFPPHIATAFKNISAHVYYAAIGILGIAAPAMLEVWKRYSFGPPFSDVLFLLILAPIFLALFGIIMRERGSWFSFLGLNIALIGCVTILASIERPSTFAPLTRFAQLEWPLVLASVCLSIAVIAASMAAKRFGVIETAIGSAVYASISSIVFAAFFGLNGFSETIDSLSLTLATIGTIGFGVPLILLCWLAKDFPYSQASSGWLLTPLILVSVSAFEGLTGYRGANPLLLGPVRTGMVMVIAGVGLSWWNPFRNRTDEFERLSATKQYSIIMIIVSSVITFFGSVALLAVAATGSISGQLDSGADYRHVWEIMRLETTGGYLMIALIALVWTISFSLYKGYLSFRDSVIGFFAGFLLFWGFIQAGNTKIINWYKWMPSEIYHSLGTPNVRVTITPIDSPSAFVAGAGTMILLLIAIGAAVREYSLNVKKQRQEQ